jgi:hypothetical protein
LTLAYGSLADIVRAGLTKAQRESVKACGEAIEFGWIRITMSSHGRDRGVSHGDSLCVPLGKGNAEIKGRLEGRLFSGARQNIG